MMSARVAVALTLLGAVVLIVGLIHLRLQEGAVPPSHALVVAAWCLSGLVAAVCIGAAVLFWRFNE